MLNNAALPAPTVAMNLDANCDQEGNINEDQYFRKWLRRSGDRCLSR